MRISDWSSDVCSSDLDDGAVVLLERIVAGSSGSALAHSTLARFEVLHLEEGVAADRGDLVGVAPARAGDVVGQEVAGAGHDLGALAGRQRPVALGLDGDRHRLGPGRSEEHTSELQSLMRISYAVFCLKKKNHTNILCYNNLT